MVESVISSFQMYPTFKFLKCPIPSCPHSPEGVRTDISSKSALIHHIKSMHSTHFHLADMQICQTANLHACSQCDCAIYTSKKTLAHHHRTKHHDSRTTTNLDLCLKHIQGKLPPNYNPIWEKGLEFIYSNIAPDPASFRAGVCGNVSAVMQTQFDDVIIGIIYAYVQAVEEFVGTETHIIGT